MSDYWLTLGLAALIGALTSALVNIWGVARSIRHKSVIEERQTWRQAIRELVPELVSTTDPESRIQIRDQIALRLNPHKDKDALLLLDRFHADPTRGVAERLVEHFQHMLKVDWERAKVEASFFPWCADRRAQRRTTRQARRA